MIGPITELEDVRTALGTWLLSEEALTAAQVKKMVQAARELALYVECNLKLKELTDQGFRFSYFSPQLRNQVRAVLDEMDTISAGTETTIKRRNETLTETKP